MLGNTLFLSILVTQFSLFTACYLWGTDSGYCSEETMDPLWRTANMPYCQYAITFPSCLPKYQVSYIVVLLLLLYFI